MGVVDRHKVRGHQARHGRRVKRKLENNLGLGRVFFNKLLENAEPLMSHLSAFIVYNKVMNSFNTINEKIALKLGMLIEVFGFNNKYSCFPVLLIIDPN